MMYIISKIIFYILKYLKICHYKFIYISYFNFQQWSKQIDKEEKESREKLFINCCC